MLTSIIKSNCITKKNDEAVLKNLMPMTTKMLETIFNDFNTNGDVTKLKVVNDIFNLYFLILFKLNSSKEAKEYIITTMTEINAFGVKIIFSPIATYVSNPPICWYGDKTIDCIINEMKVSIIKVISIYMKSLPNVIYDTNIILFHSELIKQIMIVLEDVVSNHYEVLMTSEHKQGLLVAQMIAYLNKAFDKETLMKEFKPFIRNFVKNILLPFLLITNKDIIDSGHKQDYENYAVNLEDALFNHKCKNVRSMTVMLLKTIINCNAEMEEFIVGYIIRLLNEVTNRNEEGSIFDPNDKLNTMNITNEVKLDLCMIVLIIIRRSIKSNALINTIITTLYTNFPMLLNGNVYHYIKHKICIIIKVYFSKFIEMDDPNHTITFTCLKYIYQNIFIQELPLVAMEAAQSLTVMLMYIRKSKQPFIEIITNLLNEILTIVDTTSIAAVFDVLWEIRMTIGPSQLDTKLFLALAKRVNVETAHQNRIKFIVHKSAQNEEENTFKKQSSTHDITLFINKIFNSLRLLMEEPLFVVNNKAIIEESIIPLIFYMKKPQKIDFDEDIITIIINLIKHTQSISEISLQLLLELPLYAEKNKEMLFDLYEVINLLLINGYKIIEEKEQYYKALLKVFTICSSNDKYKKSIYFVCALTHLWLCISNTIPYEIVKFFIEKSLLTISALWSKIQIDFNDKKYDFPLQIIYNFIGNLMVIYGSFINYAPITIELLNKNNQLPYLLEWTKAALKLDIVLYSNKMIILSLCKLINCDCFAKDSFTFINFAFRFLIRQQKNESCKLKAYTKKNMNYAFLSDDESDDESNDDIPHDSDDSNDDSNDDSDDDSDDSFDEDDIETMVKRTYSPYKDADEFKEYRIAVEMYQRNQPDMFIKWTNALSDNERGILLTVLKTVRIDIKTVDCMDSVPRRIVKVKRSINTN